MLKKSFLLKFKVKKKYLLILLCVIGFAPAWLVTVRLLRSFNAVKTIHLKSVGNHTTDLSDDYDELHVGCYNIAHGRGSAQGRENWEKESKTQTLERVDQIALLIKDLDLDIVVLNEVDFCSYWSGHVNQARRIARAAGYPYIIEQRNLDAAVPFMSLRFGNAILSRFPLSDAEFIDYPYHSRWMEIVAGGVKEGVAATVNLPDEQQLRVVAVHLCPWCSEDGYQSVKIIDTYRDESLPMIAMGDYNSTAEGYRYHHTSSEGQSAIDFLQKSEHWSTIPSDYDPDPSLLTFPSINPDRLIDWIFVTKQLRIQDRKVIESTLSDHLPVVARVILKGK